MPKEYLDKEDRDRGKVERPWARLAQLKKAFSLAAGDIEEAHKHAAATKQDALPLLIALARLMDHNPNPEDFTRLGKKHEGAKRIGEDWQAGRYASAKKQTPGCNAQSSTR